MKKDELISIISDKNNISKTDTKKIVDSLFQIISEELVKGNKISIYNFGTFFSTTRKATNERKIYSVFAKKEILIPSKGETTKVSFKMSNFLKNELNS